jgi:hypothetical protein
VVVEHGELANDQRMADGLVHTVSWELPNNERPLDDGIAYMVESRAFAVAPGMDVRGDL